MAKRTYRNDMSDAQKEKLRAANTGKHLSLSTKVRISRSMQKYWQSLPYKPAPVNPETADTSSTDIRPPRNPYAG